MEQLAQVLGAPLLHVMATMGASVGGFIVHVLLEVNEIRETDDSSMTLSRYFLKVPYKTTAKFMLVLGAAAPLAGPEISWVGLAGAAGLGYSADSFLNKFKNIQ